MTKMILDLTDDVAEIRVDADGTLGTLVFSKNGIGFRPCRAKINCAGVVPWAQFPLFLNMYNTVRANGDAGKT